MEVDFGRKQATVTAEKDKLDTAALVAALEKAGFGGKLLESDKLQEKKRSSAGESKGGAEPSEETRKADAGSDRAEFTVVLHVNGMKKSKSGAT